jgi:hypothetical protein
VEIKDEAIEVEIMRSLNAGPVRKRSDGRDLVMSRGRVDLIVADCC